MPALRSLVKTARAALADSTRVPACAPGVAFFDTYSSSLETYIKNAELFKASLPPLYPPHQQQPPETASPSHQEIVSPCPPMDTTTLPSENHHRGQQLPHAQFLHDGRMAAASSSTELRDIAPAGAVTSEEVLRRPDQGGMTVAPSGIPVPPNCAASTLSQHLRLQTSRFFGGSSDVPPHWPEGAREDASYSDADPDVDEEAETDDEDIGDDLQGEEGDMLSEKQEGVGGHVGPADIIEVDVDGSDDEMNSDEGDAYLDQLREEEGDSDDQQQLT
eukprot:GHVS01080656.1.p1 GENE.GHVS01080656.1~~GHVS01080656.1.p1  ORF type:complete len:275 (-),score=68.94 GHVS01080656.1:730-1554(-)